MKIYTWTYQYSVGATGLEFLSATEGLAVLITVIIPKLLNANLFTYFPVKKTMHHKQVTDNSFPVKVGVLSVHSEPRTGVRRSRLPQLFNQECLLI